MAKLYGIRGHSSYLCTNNKKIVLELDLSGQKQVLLMSPAGQC